MVRLQQLTKKKKTGNMAFSNKNGCNRHQVTQKKMKKERKKENYKVPSS